MNFRWTIAIALVAGCLAGCGDAPPKKEESLDQWMKENPDASGEKAVKEKPAEGEPAPVKKGK
ncbi:MAG: hypothetical protein JNK63_02745 [Chthonomonas sp.]|nr:hypothetical protein [Chthonomonas sp.]